MQQRRRGVRPWLRTLIGAAALVSCSNPDNEGTLAQGVATGSTAALSANLSGAPSATSPAVSSSALPSAAASNTALASATPSGTATSPVTSSSSLASATPSVVASGVTSTVTFASAAASTTGSAAPSSSSNTPEAGAPSSAGDSGAPPSSAFTLTIGAVGEHDNADCSMTSCEPCPAFPPENTGLPGQDNDSPVISWSGAPLATKGYAVVLVDLANDLTHWVVYGIPAEATGLPAALPSGDLTGDLSGAHQSSYNGTAYAGSGACNHVYEFRVYALAAALTDTSSRDAIRAELEASEFPVSFVRLRSDFAESCTPHIGAECP